MVSRFNDLPGRGNNHAIEEKAEAAFKSFLASSDHFILQQADRKDYGTDCQVEVLDQGKPSNVRLHVQLKGSERELNADQSLSIKVDRTNLNYLVAQSYSFFVAYHVPTGSLQIATVEGVLHQYEHKGIHWNEQETLTVRFSETLTLERLEALGGLALSSTRVLRDQRIAQVSAASDDLVDNLLGSQPAIHVPDDPELASIYLKKLYDGGADAAISSAFEQFKAILGVDSDSMTYCYMAEANLGMAEPARFPERIEASVEHFLKMIGSGRHQIGSLYYTIGNAYSALGDEFAAKASYEEAAGDTDFMAKPANAAQCLKNLGTSFERLGDEDRGAELYRDALEMEPQLPEANLALGLYLHRKGHLQEAIKHYDEVIFTERQLGRNSTVNGWRLSALFSTGEVREAFRAINQLLADADREPWIWPWCAQQVAAFGRCSVASATYALGFWEKYLLKHPKISTARADLLLTHLFLRQESEDIEKDYASFQTEFDNHIVQVQPEHAALPWDRLGHWAQDEELWEEAERCFRQAYELEGGHYGYCLGTALNSLGRYEEALPLVLAQAQGIQPDAMSWFQVAFANENLGRTREAVEGYRKALSLDPDYALAMFNMAGTLWNSGDYNAAAIVFRTAAEQFPENELTAKLRRDLPELFH